MDRPRRERGLGRRKACDSCCQKKIKCDAMKPKCSGCAMHNVPCVWTPGLLPSKAVVKTRKTSDNRRFEDIEQRLKAIESQLGQRGSNSRSVPEPHAARSSPYAINTPATYDNSPTSTFHHDTDDDDNNTRYPLPPRHELLPIISKYFSTFNQAIPLFHQSSFMTMVEDWYQYPSQRDEASWAAINVALALSLRHSPTENTPERDTIASTCIGNAQSVMESLVYRDQDLKGLQVVLGLAMLFLNTSHPHPTSVLVATAVTLVHRLKLHMKAESAGSDVEMAAQRNNLFWITYVVDRDISNHTTEPYLIQDHDMDVHLPTRADDDTSGVLILDDDNATVNFFHLRIQLARIKTKVYDLVYSVKAGKFSLNQKQAVTERLYRMIRDWYASIPEQFSSSNISRLEKSVQRHCISLHIVYYQCLFTAHRTQAHDSVWVKRLRDFGDSLVSQSTTDGAPDANPGPLLPPNWSDLVEAARACLGLMSLIDTHDSGLRWSTTCAFQAAIVVLAANSITVSEHDLHDQLDADAQRADEAIRELKMRLLECDDRLLRFVSTVCSELWGRAASAVARFRDNPSAGAFWDNDVMSC